MNLRKNVLALTFFTFFSAQLFAQTSLCNSVYNFLRNNKCNPKTQSLVSSSINYFPYNIMADFDSKAIRKNNHVMPEQNLFLIFNQEDYATLLEVCPAIFDFIKASEFDFDITVLFTYGEKQKIQKDGIIYGLDKFIEQVNTNEDSTAILVNLNCPESSIISTSSGLTAPSWLIKNEFDIFEKAKISHGMPVYYLSQMYTYKFNKNRQLDAFFSNGIPAIILNFGTDIKAAQTIPEIIIDSIMAFANTAEKNWDQHFLMVSLFGNYFRISEVGIVKLIIIIIFMSLVFIGLLGFINKSLQREAWHKIIKIWYAAPITFAILFFSILLSKGIFAIFAKRFLQSGKLYFFGGSCLITSFIFTTCYYWLQIFKNHKYDVKSVDFIIVIIIFLNQFIFSLFDISLLPLFVFVCILAILMLIFKNNLVHIFLLIVSIIPFGLYAHALIKVSDTNELFNWIYQNTSSMFFISLVLTPLFLMYFRILSAFHQANDTKKSLFVMGGTSIGAALIFTVVIGCVRTAQINRLNTHQEKPFSLIKEKDDAIDISWSDKQVFDDTVRKLTVTFSKPCYQCDVRITVKDGTPLLYSLDDYELLNPNTASFIIPNSPPQNLTFNYGVSKEPCNIKVTAYFATNDKDKFSLLSKSITIK